MGPRTITVTPPADQGNHAGVFFQNSRFDSLIEQHGYKVYKDKFIICPCRDVDAGHAARPGCKNCGGTGTVFYNRTETIILLTEIKTNFPSKQWSEEVRGTFNITVKETDTVAMMDRITMYEALSTYNQLTKFYEDEGGEYSAYLVYEPKEIEDVFLFSSEDVKLQHLTQGTDFAVIGNRLKIDKKWGKMQDGKRTLSVRYKHNPQYYIIDLTREIMTSPVLLDETGNTAQKRGKAKTQAFPTHGMARRAHYVLDMENKLKTRLFDNSYNVGYSNQLNIND